MFEKGSQSVAQADLELALYPRLSWNSLSTLCTMYVPCVLGGQKTMLDSLKLELQVVAYQRMNIGN